MESQDSRYIGQVFDIYITLNTLWHEVNYGEFLFSITSGVIEYVEPIFENLQVLSQKYQLKIGSLESLSLDLGQLQTTYPAEQIVIRIYWQEQLLYSEVTLQEELPRRDLSSRSTFDRFLQNCPTDGTMYTSANYGAFPVHLQSQISDEGGDSNILLELRVIEGMFERDSFLYEQVQREDGSDGTRREQINLRPLLLLQSLHEACMKTEFTIDLTLERDVRIEVASKDNDEGEDIPANSEDD